MALRRVVVTGMGALTPIGNDVESYWNGLVSGKSGADHITYFDTSKFKTQFACELKGYDPLNHFDRKEARKLDKFAQYAIVCSDEAIKNANLELDSINKNRVGVIWGSGIGGLETFQIEATNYAMGDGTPRYNPFFIPKIIPDIAPGVISIKHGFKGPNHSVVTACSSGAHAIGDAARMIMWEDAEVMVAGGTEAAICKLGIHGFAQAKALSTAYNDTPERASRPWDKNRDGFVIGEGAGILVLEDFEHV